MNLYAESSAVLAWLLGDTDGESVREALSGAEIVLASQLTLIECSRILIRAGATGRLTEGQAADREARLRQVEPHWTLLEIDAEIVERARRPFPLEPIRILDAVHLASALWHGRRYQGSPCCPWTIVCGVADGASASC